MKRNIFVSVVLLFTCISYAQSHDGFSPAVRSLSDAIKIKSLEEVENMIKAGYNPNAHNADGITPLHEAVMENQAEIVKYLLAHGANPNIPDRDNEAALHHAAVRGNVNLVKVLSDAGAQLEAQAAELKQTPLFYAATVDAVKALIKAGSNVNARDKTGKTPLFYIADKFAPETVRALLDGGANINITEYESGNTPLHVATKRGKLNLIKTLLENKADVTIRNYKGWLPYDYAMASNDKDVLALFEKYKPMPTDRTTRSKGITRESRRYKKIRY